MENFIPQLKSSSMFALMHEDDYIKRRLMTTTSSFHYHQTRKEGACKQVFRKYPKQTSELSFKKKRVQPMQCEKKQYVHQM